jgi:NADH:ubiquinone oxidoreductase subunit 6 (subunit J)
VYEVFLLVFYLPRSISSYIGKQYEIITLIVIRRIFKDIGNIELTDNWFQSENDLQFSYDLITAIILFFLIQQFYKILDQQAKKEIKNTIAEKTQLKITKFIQLKKTIATILIPVVLVLAIYSFANWIIVNQQSDWNDIATFKNINNIFFEDFFILLIIIDVILLLFSFFYSDSFHKIIRNSGFVISTILIKLSFSVHGIINNALILGAVVFGFLILIIHNSYKSSSDATH